MVLFEGPSRDAAHPAIDRVAETLEARAPGPEDVFGAQVWLDDLRGKIGRDEDSNTNLTRRMLSSSSLCRYAERTHTRERGGR
jgi:hypothetical protein